MSNGIVLPILDYTEFNYAWATGLTEEQVLVDRVPVAPFTKIGLSIRLHRRNIGTSGSFQFIVRGIDPSREDGQDFVFATDLGSTPTVINTTTVPGLLQLSTLIQDVQHPMIRVVLRVIGPTSGAMFGIFSGDLVMKTG